MTGMAVTSDSSAPRPVTHNIPVRKLRWMFTLLIMIQVMLNYDSGAIPAGLSDIKRQFNLSYVEDGLLGSLVYVGLTVSCLISGPLLQRFKPKRVVAFTLSLNAGFCLLFAAAPNTVALMFSRVGVGMSHAFMVIYTPVWVDEFAPRESCTLWMSLGQAGAPLGIMLGYLVSGIVSAQGGNVRIAFFIQTALLIPLILILYFVPGKYMNQQPLVVTGTIEKTTKKGKDQKEQTRVDVIPDAAPTKIWPQLKLLFRRPVFIWTVNCLCALYFVVTGIQLWVTAYLTDVILAPKGKVVTAFAITSATGPILGVVFGGWLMDRVGGYQGGLHTSAKIAAIFGLIAVGSGFPALFVTSFIPIIVFVWFLLFWGGAVVPPATGILLVSVPKSMRSFASSVSMLAYNLLGYFAGPFISGVVAEAANDLSWGFRLCLIWSFMAFFSMASAWFFALRVKRKGKRSAEATQSEIAAGVEAGEDDEGEDSFDPDLPVPSEDLRYEIARMPRKSFAGVLPMFHENHPAHGQAAHGH
eukprot:Colp12_sorted_trinity150504_noHs@25141